MATYINLDNLARYDMKAKARAEGLYADASAACWQKTEKAGAVTCVPAPETPLEPVVEFLFKETLPSGTKGPSNPSTIAGTSSINVARCGKNLLPYPFGANGSKEVNGITFTDNGDGTVTANGTATDTATYRLTTNPMANFWCKEGITYTLSGCPEGGTLNQALRYYYAQYNGVGRDVGGSLTYVSQDNRASAGDIVFITGTVASNLLFKPQLEIGGVATEFEKGSLAITTINLGSTFYGGTLDVASGKLTVTHRMVEPSSGTVDISDRPALLPLEYTDTYGRTVTSDGNTLSVGSSGGQIVYRLANPYTVYVDPVQIDSLPALGRTSPRINTVYTDALNVQVGYAEHPAYTEELINNAILALGGNI